MRARTSSSILCNHLLQNFSFFNPRRAYTKQVSSLFTASSLTVPSLPSPSSPTHQTSKAQIDLSSINCTGIAQSVISRCSHLFDRNEDKRENFTNEASLRNLLLDISDVIPDITRRFRRALILKPEDVHEIFLGFQFECERDAIKGRKVESLWGIFKWATGQNNSFRHLPKSCEVMASVLIRYGMFREVQLLLLAMERQGISLDNNGIFERLVAGYVGADDLERAILVYDRMREQDLVPSYPCYQSLIDLSVRMKRSQFAYRVCLDMLDMRISLSDGEKFTFENLVKLLCADGMIQEARNLTNIVMDLGFGPSSLAFNEIACGYCEKRDFEDSLILLAEMHCSPNILAGNKIIYSLCCNFGVEKGNLFRLELENLGFRPDGTTFGILIGWCCSERNLRSAFIYLSDMLAKGLKPDIWSYNSIISAVFKVGMWKHAQAIFEEMVDGGIKPNSSTFRILLAGYCKARQFDKAKMMIQEMVAHGLIESSSVEESLSKAFTFLGLNPLSVKLKRDNYIGFSKTEFFDNLGNGLYLDTDIDEYENTLDMILEDSLVPDFNVILRMECDQRNYKAALMVVDEMVHRGQEPSLPVFSTLLKGLCASRTYIRVCSGLMGKMQRLANQLDHKVLNFLVQAYYKKGLANKGRIIFRQMLQRNLPIENETYTAALTGLCKRGILLDFHDCWDAARNDNWLPGLKDSMSLVECICHRGMLKEALELFESLLVAYPHSRSEIFRMFLEKLSYTGFTSIAHNLVEELLQQGCVLDDISYNHLIRGFCKEKKYAVAFTILDMLLARNLVPCLDVSLILVPKLCRFDRLEKAIALREIGMTEQSTFSFSVHCALIKGFCMTGRIGEAAKVLQDLLLKGMFPDTEICNVLLQGYCQVDNLKKARELLVILIRKYMNLSISSYRKWVHLMCWEDRVIHALSLKDLMLGENKSKSLVIYNILVFYLLLAGNCSLVNKLLNELQENGLELDEVSYNFLVYGFSKCKDVSSSLHYLSIMTSKGFRPSYRSLRTVITCLCDSGELGKAIELSAEMELRGWVHGSVVQNAIVEGLLAHNKLQEAEHFLDRVANKGLIPDSINYDNLIKQFCCYGRLNKAVDLLNIMLKKGNIPNSTSYDSVIQGLCRLNQLSQAMDFVTEMSDKDLKPCINTWDVLVHKFCQLGQTAEAEKLLIWMVQVGVTPTRSMYSCLIDRYRLENNPRKASELMQMMQQSGYDPDFETHWSLISNLSDSNCKGNHSSQGLLSRLLSGTGFSSSNSKARSA